jgi:hypothetical protein
MCMHGCSALLHQCRQQANMGHPQQEEHNT